MKKSNVVKIESFGPVRNHAVINLNCSKRGLSEKFISTKYIFITLHIQRNNLIFTECQQHFEPT
jgi:hypothetical protein